MELHLPSVVLGTIIIVAFLHLLHRFKTTQNPRETPQLPPSPWRLPIVGHLHHLLMGGSCPHHTLRDLAAIHGPVMHLKLGEIDHVVISSPEAAKEVTNTHDLNFAHRPRLLFTTIILYNNTNIGSSPYGGHWRNLRKICALELLSPARVRSFRPIMDEAIASLVADISRHSSPINLSRQMLELSNVIMAMTVVGKECRHGPRLVAAMRVAMLSGAGLSLADVFPSLPFLGLRERAKLVKIHLQLDGILDEILDDHRPGQDGGEDLVDVLLRIKEEEAGSQFPLTITSVKAVIMDMFFAGVESSSGTMEWAMAELVRYPEEMKKVQAELRGGATSYLEAVIKETMRLHPPVPLLLPRLCEEACEVGGFWVPKGSRVLVNAWAMGRDERWWEEPERFMPGRFEGSSVDFRGGSFEFLPFGAGRRVCPGIEFGMAGMELALAQLLLHFDWELPEGMKPEELDMTESFRTTVGRKSELLLVATPPKV